MEKEIAVLDLENNSNEMKTVVETFLVEETAEWAKQISDSETFDEQLKEQLKEK